MVAEETVIGDLNNDDVIDIFDVAALRKLLLTGNNTPTPDSRIDLNRDGYLNVADLVKLQRYVLGYSDSSLTKVFFVMGQDHQEKTIRQN
jgi:arabinogalactan endo-1,4-beta-galactosidase